MGEARNGAAQKGLGGVSDAVAPGRHRLAAGVTKVVLVVDEERRPELPRQFEKVDATDVKVAVVVDGGGPREELALQGRRGEVVVDERRFRRHGLQDTAAFVVPVSPDEPGGACRLRSSPARASTSEVVTSGLPPP